MEQAMLRLLVVLAAFPLLLGTSACASDLPQRPNGPIGDFADILPAKQEAELDTKLRAFFDVNCIALVVASVSSLQNEAIDRYANRLAKNWEIGDAHSKQGLLLLVAPHERRVRIEISNAVNRVITDADATSIIQDTIVPSFRTGDLASGTIRGADAIITRLDAGRDTDGLDRTSCHQEGGSS
jgi:uncharacterized protein